MPGKKYADAAKKYDKTQLHEPAKAFELVKSLANRNFDETVEVAFKLGVDPRKADQMLRSTVSLPAGTGKDVRVAVFAAGDAAQEARDAGADVVGADDLVKRVQEGFLDFDVAIATPDLMGQVGKLGRVLGPRGLMPNPKTGTVVGPEQIGEAVREVKGGRIDFKVEKAGIVHVSIGRASMEAPQLRDNLLALMQLIVRLKPSTAKGTYVRSVSLSSTMGPGVRLDPNEVVRLSGDVR